MLIGITRRLPGRKQWMETVEYQFTSLLKGNTMIRSQEHSTQDTVICELMSFKEECVAIELALVGTRAVRCATHFSALGRTRYI